MKRIIALLMCMLTVGGFVINASAENSSDITDLSPEYTTIASIPNLKDSATPENQVINSINVTFYVINGKAYASYYVASQKNGVTITVQMFKGGVFQKPFGESKTEETNKKYLSGSYSLPVDGTGVYWVYISVTSGGETKYKEVKYVYIDNVLRGDANRNGKIQADDARLILRFAARLEKYDNGQKALCDIDKDGYITAADARLALNLAASLAV